MSLFNLCEDKKKPYINARVWDLIVDNDLIFNGGIDLIDDETFIINNADNTKRLGFDLSGGSPETTTILSTIQTTDKTITFPDIEGTVVVTEGNQTINGVKTFDDGILLGTSPTNLNFHEVYTAPVNYEGIYDTPVAKSWTIEKIGRTVTIYLPACKETSNGSSSLNIDGIIPSRFDPIVVGGALLDIATFSVPLTNNGLAITGGTVLVTPADGNIAIIFPTTTSGIAGIGNLFLTWLTA